jgi:cation diffusion facilitator family transporter
VGSGRDGSILDSLVEAERVAQLSVFTLAAIGAVELTVAQLTGSVAVKADGVDSVADATLSIIVWLGLRFSRRARDEKFHFGYHKVESFAAFIAASAMAIAALFIIYQSYLRFVSPMPLNFAFVALGTLIGAGGVSLYRAFQMKKIARKYDLVSLRTAANNSIKDTSASFLVFVSVLAAYFGFPEMDAVGGMAVAGYILTVSYLAIKESSLVLVDSFHRPELIGDISRIVEKSCDHVRVADTKLRKIGPYITGEMTILVDGRMTVAETDKLVQKIESEVKEEVSGLQSLSIMVRSSTFSGILEEKAKKSS